MKCYQQHSVAAFSLMAERVTLLFGSSFVQTFLAAPDHSKRLAMGEGNFKYYSILGEPI